MPQKLSLTKKTVRNPKKTSRLAEKLETPSSSISSRKKAVVRNNTFSLVKTNNGLAGGISVNVNSSSESKWSNGGLPLKRNNFIVRLKVNKVLYQQVFQPGMSKGGCEGSVVRSPDQIQLRASKPETKAFDTVSNISEISLEINREKTIEIPEIYPLSQLDIQPDKVSFKYLGDLDQDSINKRLNERNRNLSNKKIHVILSSFKNKKEWPKSSPYACWNCTENFEGPPVGIPTIANTQSDNYEDSYHLEGNFCSFNCAARYLFDQHPNADSQLWTIYEIMNCLYNELNEFEDYTKIKLAPERICLKKFGGILTLAEYRRNNLTEIEYKVFKPPMIPALYHIQETMDLSKIIKASREARA